MAQEPSVLDKLTSSGIKFQVKSFITTGDAYELKQRMFDAGSSKPRDERTPAEIRQQEENLIESLVVSIDGNHEDVLGAYHKTPSTDGGEILLEASLTLGGRQAKQEKKAPPTTGRS